METKQYLAIRKGWTLIVESWENDGDYSITRSLTVDSKERAKGLWDLMQLCSDHSRVGLGNAQGAFTRKQKKAMEDCLKANPILLEGFDLPENEEDRMTDWSAKVFGELTYPLLDYSEFYLCRVMESCRVTYSDRDVYVEEIDFSGKI